MLSLKEAVQYVMPMQHVSIVQLRVVHYLGTFTTVATDYPFTISSAVTVEQSIDSLGSILGLSLGLGIPLVIAIVVIVILIAVIAYKLKLQSPGKQET